MAKIAYVINVFMVGLSNTHTRKCVDWVNRVGYSKKRAQIFHYMVIFLNRLSCVC